MRTFCTVIQDTNADTVLSAWAEINAKALPWMFKQLHVLHRPLAAVKVEAQRRFKLTGRQVNGLRFEIDQAVAAWSGGLYHRKANLEDRIEGTRGHIERLGRQLAKPDLSRRKAKRAKFIQHQKKRHLDRCQHSLADVVAEQERGIPVLCFGGRDLLRRGEIELWRQRRASRIFLVGSKGETSGNQTCHWDGSRLVLRLPDALYPAGAKNKTITLEGVSFRYGQKVALAALANDQSLTWLLFRREDGRWAAHVTINEVAADLVTDLRNGVFAFDLNIDHVAIVRVDIRGNPVGERITLPFPTAETPTGKAEAMLGEVTKVVTDLALRYRCGIACEDLDFAKKKTALKVFGTNHARRLSGFSYAAVFQMLDARCQRIGIDLHRVNPAYTSVIGRTKYARSRAMSGHHAAALVIGRRALGFGERLVCMHHVTLASPARMKSKHVWGRWRNVSSWLTRELSNDSAITAQSESGTKRNRGISSAHKALDTMPRQRTRRRCWERTCCDSISAGAAVCSANGIGHGNG